MLLADARLDVSKTFTGRLDDTTVASLKDAFADMEEEARALLIRDFAASEVLFERYGEMRYVGQRHNIKVPLPDTPTRSDPHLVRSRLQAKVWPRRRPRQCRVPGRCISRLSRGCGGRS
jgi:N-methylhydantoinase A/oxoprolinase/acetone carboxylase beta subunit